MKFVVRFVLTFAFCFSIAACGVKGDPKPPANPAEIGKGKPLFKGDPDNKPSFQQFRTSPETEQEDDKVSDE